MNAIGVEPFVSHATKLGISTWTDPSRFGLSLTLGGGEVHMTDMATAFGVFANGGNKTDVTNILKIQDTKERGLYELRPAKRKLWMKELPISSPIFFLTILHGGGHLVLIRPLKSPDIKSRSRREPLMKKR